MIFMDKKEVIPKDRPAFHVDIKLKEAAKKAAEVFGREEEELQDARYAKV